MAAAEFFQNHNHILACAALAASSGIAAYSTYQLLKARHGHNSHGHGNDSEFIEWDKWSILWLSFQYGGNDLLDLETFDYDKIADCSGSNCVKTFANEIIAVFHNLKGVPNTVMDVGCGLGGLVFQLSRTFEKVVGLEYSHSFLKVCNRMKTEGHLDYTKPLEGEIKTSYTARVDSDIDRNRVEFVHGDACNLDPALGPWGCLVISNVLHHLPDPKAFLERAPRLLVSGGLLVIADCYVWSEHHLPKKNWLGGYIDSNGKVVSTFESLKNLLGSEFDFIQEKELPYLLRISTNRDYMWGCKHITFWRKK